MERSLFIFVLLLSPLFVRAGGPELVKCDAQTGIGVLIMLSALGVLCYLLLQERKKVREKVTHMRRMLENKLAEMEYENRQLKDENSTLKHRFETMTAESTPVYIALPALPPPKEIYAGLPSGRLLYRISENFEPQFTYFVIELDPRDPSRGKLSLVDDEVTRVHAFSMIEGLRDACELLSTGSPRTSASVIEEAGEVIFENGLWNIIRKIKLTW